MASKKSKILAFALCAAIMAGIHVNPVFAAPFEEDVGYQSGNISGTELKDLNIEHPRGPHDDPADCREDVENTDLTIGDINKVVDDLVDNDKYINGKVDKVASDVKDLQDQVNNIETTADTDTFVKDGTYKADENGNVTMDVVDKNGDPVKDESGNDKKVVIEDVASKEKLDETTATANDAYSKAEQALSENEAQNAILDEHGKEITAVKEKNEQQDSRLDNHEAVIGVTDKTGLESAYEGATYIDKNDTMVEADRKLDAAISDVNSRVDGLENRVDKVGAMAAAIANLRTMGYDPAAPTEVAVGVGQYRDETGMALGLFHYPNRDFMLSLSVSTSGDEYMGGIGATWKFGRKSPEKVAEIKKAQAEADARRAEEQKLAKAEEMKKAAKEAKVQAQMERHAKMLAEQEAQA